MNNSILALVVAAFAAACVPPDPGVRATIPTRPPDSFDVTRTELTFASSDGIQLYGQRWAPKSGEAKAVLIIHHGLADHSDRYAGFAERATRAGFVVWSYDMRGHGRSAGKRIYFDRIDALLDDLDIFLARVRSEDPDKPIFLYGHSIGGLTVGLFAIERQPQVAGVVLAAPGIAFDTGPLGAAAVRFVAAVSPNAKVLDTPHPEFSKDPKVVHELDTDPLVHQDKGPARTARASLDAVARVWAHPERLVAPLLIVHGRADQVTAPSGSRDLVARAGATDRTLRLYDGLYHDVFHDPDGDKVAADVIAWLDAHAGGAAVVAPARTTEKLPGDRAAMSLAIELDARGDHADDGSGLSGGVRIRLGLGGRVGYLGGLDLRGGYFHGGRYEADLHALGLAVRSAGGATLSITGGIGAGGLRGSDAVHVPVELALEAPLGPTRLLARAGVGWVVSGDDYATTVGFADELTALVGVRLGRDIGYWSTVRAGTGPFLAGAFRDLGGTKIYGIVVGGELWGGN
jgi:alpha-beta hydrolase superfamily lysophospholipase